MLEKLLKKCYDEENLADKSSESIKTAVLSRIEEGKPMKRKWGKKAVLISAIAFAVVGSATAVVAGANGWNLKTAISGLFDEDKNDGSAFFGYDINGIGSKELDQTFERDGYTVNMVGTVADQYTAYLLYDVVVETGHVFESEHYTDTYSVDDEVWIYLSVPFNDDMIELQKRYYREHENASLAQTDASQGAKTNLISQDGNVYHYATRFDFKPISLENEEITFEFGGPVVNNIDYDAMCEISDLLTVKFDFIEYNDERYMEINEPFEFNGETYALDCVELTPFSLFLRISQESDVYLNDDLMGEFIYKSEAVRDNVKVTFKDGTISNEEMLFKSKTLVGGAATNDNRHVFDDIHLNWSRPVNVDDVESITIGDTTFTLN